MSLETSDLADVPSAIMKVAHILNGVNDEGKKLSLGPVNMRGNRYLMILYLATLSPTYKVLAMNLDNKFYFSMSNLKKVSKNTYIPLQFDRSRALEVFQKHTNNNLAELRVNNKVSRIAITETGKKECLQMLKDLITTNFPNEKNEFLQPIYSTNDKSITKDLLLLGDYLKRKDVSPLFARSPKFYGRVKELKYLESFLGDKYKQILFISGEGGIGKTRLTLEYLKQISNRESDLNWKVFFIHPYKTITEFPTDNKVLLILDDAKRYSGNIHSLLDYVINPPEGTELKMIIIERSVFADEIESKINQKNGDFQRFNLPKEDLTQFLVSNFPGIDEKTADEIDSKCQGNYEYAAFCAEYSNKNGMIDKDLMSIISWKVEKYLEDISQRTGIKVDEVKHYLKILSLIMPFDWVHESKFLKELLPDFDMFMKVLFDAKYKYENNLIYTDGPIFVIKPDPVSDFFKLSTLEDQKFEGLILELMKYYPSRILYHISSVRKSDYLQLKNSIFIAVKAWLLLNESRAYTMEYFDAIETLCYSLTNYEGVSDLIIKMSPKQWVESFEEFFYEKPPRSILDNLIKSLYYAYIYFAEKELYEECSRILDYFNRLFIRYQDTNLEIIQALCYEKMCDHVRENSPEKLNRFTLNIRQLYKKYPLELSPALASTLVKGLLYYRSHGSLTDAQRIFRYTDELRTLYDRNPSEKMAIILCSGLVVSIDIYLEHKLLDKVLGEYNLIKSILDKYPNEKIVDYLNYINYTVKILANGDIGYRCQELEMIINEELSRAAPLELRYVDNKNIDGSLFVDFDTHQITYNGRYVFVLDNKVLPRLDLETKLTVQDYYTDMHGFISIEIENEKERELNLILCPNRISNDTNLKTMLKYIGRSSIDSLTDLAVGKATIGIINQKGYDIIRNPNITKEEQERLMLKNDCVIQGVSKSFPTINILLEDMQDPKFAEQFKKVSYCSYCDIDYDQA